MAEPAYTRMQVDDRRRQLLERGAELFATHSFAELSMARIAREAGISKALLYHYFPSKQDFFVATLQQGALEGSNVDLSDSMVDMMDAQRSYSMASKAIHMQDQMMEIANGVKQ